MPTLTLKGLPDDVYHALKERAAANRRSLNSEVIVRLEQSVAAGPACATRPPDVDAILARADEIRTRIQARIERLGLPPITADEITAAKHEGRP